MLLFSSQALVVCGLLATGASLVRGDRPNVICLYLFCERFVLTQHVEAENVRGLSLRLVSPTGTEGPSLWKLVQKFSEQVKCHLFSLYLALNERVGYRLNAVILES